MNIKDIINKHSENVLEEEREFNRLIREEIKDLNKVDASVAIIKGIIETDANNGWIGQVFDCGGRDFTIQEIYCDYDRRLYVDVDYSNGYIDLRGLSPEEYSEVKEILGKIKPYLKCEW